MSSRRIHSAFSAVGGLLRKFGKANNLVKIAALNIGIMVSILRLIAIRQAIEMPTVSWAVGARNPPTSNRADGAGLKLDRVFSWRRWSVTWRLLAVTMPLSIAAITLLGVWGLGLPWVIALLVGASLAPTDPVLAADVQVGPPKGGQEDEVRFGLTSEAGLNDGFAFPFVNLAIALSLSAVDGEPWLGKWLAHSVIWKSEPVWWVAG